jgi:putative NADH-flavin reductase
MNIAIIGATSGTGRSFLDQALAKGHRIRALARRPEALAAYKDRLEIRTADVYNPESLGAALGEDIEVLVSSFGASGLMEARRVTDLYSRGTTNLIAACEQRGVRRLISVSSGGVEPQPNDGWFFRSILKPLFLERMYEDMRRMEALVRASKLDWTLVRPPYLTNAPRTERYRVQRDKAFDDDKNLSRADLAHFLMRVCEKPGWGKVTVSISD